MRAAIVRDSDGFVTNVISVDDLSHPVNLGHTLIQTDIAGPGWSYDGTAFIPSPEALPGPPDPNDELVNALEDFKTTATIPEIIQLVDVLLGLTGKSGRIAGRPV